MKVPERIVSLLPSSTEILFALGLGERVVGVSHECDFPAAAAELPRLTRARLDSSASSADIDRQVRQLVTQGLSIYDIDEERLRQLSPDLILTQDTCRVCAVSLDQVQAATQDLLGAEVQIVSLRPAALADVLDDIERVGAVAGVVDAATGLRSRLRYRLDALRDRIGDRKRPRVLALEWLSPPMVAGHWTPELIRVAGGEPVLGHDGSPTSATTWQAIAAAEPDQFLVIPCGFAIAQTLRELPSILDIPEVAAMDAVRRCRVALVDGNAYFNRPGPRLVDSAEIAAVAFHPDLGGDLPVPPQALLRYSETGESSRA